MTELLLLVIVCQLAWLIHKMKKPEKETKQSMDYQKVMPDYIGRQCELSLKKPLYELGTMHSLTGTIIDCDSEWVLIGETVKNKPVQKLLRISNIRTIKEITS